MKIKCQELNQQQKQVKVENQKMSQIKKEKKMQPKLTRNQNISIQNNNIFLPKSKYLIQEISAFWQSRIQVQCTNQMHQFNFYFLNIKNILIINQLEGKIEIKYEIINRKLIKNQYFFSQEIQEIE
ncbi:hypothetical protein TTHERM_000581609 (macronuclear) [Tetrahymena thermophila SB210]|uniref:Uncharacterized protein n=1 Tax=Tetrahymena thermophila (strain SB210) TaxID=312017 RepID=W7XIW0_TETTS|nr:hypothetical protein TTHERM_000581609 [Tetrahymena thermophila SB210]EWS73649.1 hypothetical protein TTHERM_000581609 [Tetrahymena thermophila SB210]|eukprot:XP_012653779.1 hypothetical protein TTHERM_000581609 [Tetrahymena thermophila SB210]